MMDQKIHQAVTEGSLAKPTIMTEDKVRQNLKRLATLREDVEQRRKTIAEQRDSLIPQEVKDALEEFDQEFDGALDGINKEANDLQASIRSDVLYLGKSVASDHLSAKLSNRTSWDNGMMKAFVKVFPDIEDARKVSQSVTFVAPK